ncbi:hypothetical protein GGU10DRAFT_370275, partial [Lentinula aff. detonsa]
MFPIIPIIKFRFSHSIGFFHSISKPQFISDPFGNSVTSNSFGTLVTYESFGIPSCLLFLVLSSLIYPDLFAFASRWDVWIKRGISDKFHPTSFRSFGKFSLTIFPVFLLQSFLYPFRIFLVTFGTHPTPSLHPFECFRFSETSDPLIH